jgi:hypothetical protein
MRRPIVLTAEEAASALGITTREIPGLIETGILEGFPVGADFRIRVASVEAISGPLPDEFFELIRQSME